MINLNLKWILVLLFSLTFNISHVSAQNEVLNTGIDSFKSAHKDKFKDLGVLTNDSLKTDTYPNFIAPNYNGFLGEYNVSDVPSPRGNDIIGYVSDPDNVVLAQEEQRINEILYDLEQNTSVEVAVVILPSIGQEIPKTFAVNLFKEWGIGKSSTDNGLLILTVIDQRRTEFEVGYGLEPILTDVVCYRIGINEIVPFFKQARYGAGLESAITRITEFLDNPEVIEEVYGYGVAYPNEEVFLWQWYHLLFLIYGLICLVMGFWYFGQAFDIQRSKDDFYDKYHRLDKLKFGCTQVLFPLPMLFFSRIAKNRLKHYRYAARFSKKNGKSMTLLTNYDEIDYLEEAQLLEEELNTILYDVWITDDKSDIMILEYVGPNGRNYSDCSECGFRAFGKNKSYVSKPPTFYEEGERIDYYQCRNCNFTKEKSAIIAMISNSDSSSSSSSTSSFSSSSSSSSSSSFGGGSSGGGGSGVSW
jgi:uncharacterized protein